MDAQMLLQHLPSTANCLQACPGVGSGAIISAKIAPGLLTLENRGNAIRLGWPVGNDVRPVTAPGQGHFQRASGKPLRLRPEHSAFFQPVVSLGFAAPIA